MRQAPPATLLRRARLAFDAGDAAAGEPVSVLFEGGRVAAIFPENRSAPPAAGVPGRDCRGRWLLPGWVDAQVNDIAWMSRGLQPPASHRRRILEVCRHQAERGVTGFILATLAAPEEEVLAYLEGMALALRDRDAGGEAEAFLGGLVEGTFMNPSFHGAHNPAHVRPPEMGLLDRLLDTGAVRLINVAPEMSPDAIGVIARAAGRGAVVGIGHARPHALRVREAVRAGARYIIHWGNGPTGSNLKSFSGGGLLEESLCNDALAVTLIIDGIHLDLRLVRDVIARKGIERTIAVSDAGFATGNPRGEFEVFGIRGRVSADGRYLQVLPSAGGGATLNPLSSEGAPLFGSAADMRRIFETCLNMLIRDAAGIYHRRHGALELAEALRQASQLCSANPARLLGESDRGRLEPGARADAVLVDLRPGGAPEKSSAGGSEQAPGEAGEQLEVAVDGVWVGGREVRMDAERKLS